LLATITLLVLLLILRFSRVVVIAALGASAFIVFAMPKNVTAQPRNVIGGHAVGILSGTICTVLIYREALASFLGLDFEVLMIIAASVSVGLTIFIMVVTDTEHPPGCSTALAVIVHGWDLYYVAFIIICATIMIVVKHLLNPWLKDLV
jgi:CBS-domain-containing membrane protein